MTRHSSRFPGRLWRPINLPGRPGPLRHLRPLPFLVVAVVAAQLLAPALASADSSSTLTVVGTSDVSDSGLVPNLIQPEFHSAYPQFSFHYIGTASGTAITDAETGSVGASVLIVHAASLENQFVAGGYSYEQYGRAIFTNDFVLAGPTGDPAGVSAAGATNGSNNIVQAFADIAAAGYNSGGTPLVTFVSRGGTPGTTVEEHQIWALVASLASPPAGLHLCTVSAADGGGETPVSAASGLGGQPCGGLPPSGDLPTWYVTTGVTQGPNVVDANACTGYASPANSCYVLTDRGTYDYLASGADPAGAIPTLAILTRNNSTSAPGGADELINYFHSYIVNPAKPSEQVNLTAAEDFVNFLTSPALQAQLKTYLDDTTDPGGPPFVADASPSLTDAGIPSVDAAGTPVTVTGTLTNAEPGYPALASQTVTVDEIEAGLPVAVASGTTNSSGSYSITFTPTSSGAYQVATGQIAQVENSALSPVFGDLLSPAATAAVTMSVQGSVSIASASARAGIVTVSGSIAPAAPDANAAVALLARPSGSTKSYSEIGAAPLVAGQSSYTISSPLAKGSWQLETSYTDPGALLAATATSEVTVDNAGGSSVTLSKAKVSAGKLTLTGTISPDPIATGARVELFGLRSGSTKFTKLAAATLKIDQTTFTIKAKLRRGYHWILQLEYVQTGQRTSYSKLSTIDVH
jgi:ABC-type tungstate transport system permease subunit